MATDSHPKPSFSPYRKWGVGLHVGVLVLVVLSVVVMANYISQDYFLRFHISTRSRIELSPRTAGLLHSLTNRVNVTLYYDAKDEKSLYGTVADLLAEYRLVNPRITVQTVDYIRDPGLAQKVKAKYNLPTPTDKNLVKNLVIFDCDGRVKTVEGDRLASYVIEPVANPTPEAKEPEFRRKPTAFLGEIAFTAALLDVTSVKPLKAYFLQGHGEHQIDSGDPVFGYLKLASILQQNCIKPEPLSLLGTNAVPADCNLLVIAGPRDAISDAELEKIEQYLINRGGRLLALFNYGSFRKDTGLERLLAKWGVDVGHNVVTDPDNAIPQKPTDIIVSNFGTGKHPVVNCLLGLGLHLSSPRTVGQMELRAEAADAPQVEEIAFTGPRAAAAGDLGHKPPLPLIVAVEKGALKDVITERGATRLIVVGDSLFLGNTQIDSLANRDFADAAVNWLLERTQLLAGVGPRPMMEYRVVMTKAQMHQAQWLLLGALPGGVLVLGGLVWLRRRR
jgi:gliding motility-associatede transport system auxiliary component